MKIIIASLCLRFYKRDGWTHKKVQALLVDKTRRVSYRKGEYSNHSSYYAVYSNGFNWGKEVRFTKDIFKHEIVGEHEINSYIKEEK